MSEKTRDYILKIWISLSVLLVLSLLVYIFGYIFKNGLAAIDFDFIFSGPKGRPIGSEGGIFPAIVGSVFLMLIACIFAAIFALSTSIYIVFYSSSKKVEKMIHLIIQSMAGIPSIVLGLFGYSFLVLGLGLGRSLLAGGLTLSIMIFPYMQIRIEKTFREVEEDLIESSYALGASKSFTIFRLILPLCKSDIVSTITLAGGYAMGASAPIIATAAVLFAPAPRSLLSPVMALPFHLYILTGEGISLEKAYGTALILLVLLLILNVFSLALNLKRREDL